VTAGTVRFLSSRGEGGMGEAMDSPAGEPDEIPF